MMRYRIHRSAHRGVGWEIDHTVDDELTLHVGRARTLAAAVRRVRTDARAISADDETDVEITLPMVHRRRRGRR